MTVESSSALGPDGSNDISIFIAFRSPMSVPTTGHLATGQANTRPGIAFLLSGHQFGLAKTILEDIHDLASVPQQANQGCLFGRVPDNRSARFVHDNTDTWSGRSVGRHTENQVDVSWTLTNLPGTDDRQKIRFHIANARPDRRVIGIAWTATSNSGQRYSQNTSVGGLNGKGAVDSQTYTPFGDFECIASVSVRAVSCPASNSGGAAGSYMPSCVAESAAPTQRLGASEGWTAYAYKEGSGQVCYLAGEPQKRELKDIERKTPRAIVTHRPDEKVTNTVSFAAGLPLKEGSDASVDIGGTKFDLFTKADSAWARTANLDKAIVEAMAKGKQAVVKSIAQKGEPVTDTYSLAGFTQALSMIDKACSVKR